MRQDGPQVSELMLCTLAGAHGRQTSFGTRIRKHPCRLSAAVRQNQLLSKAPLLLRLALLSKAVQLAASPGLEICQSQMTGSCITPRGRRISTSPCWCSSLYLRQLAEDVRLWVSENTDFHLSVRGDNDSCFDPSWIEDVACEDTSLASSVCARNTLVNFGLLHHTASELISAHMIKFIALLRYLLHPMSTPKLCLRLYHSDSSARDSKIALTIQALHTKHNTCLTSQAR